MLTSNTVPFKSLKYLSGHIFVNASLQLQEVNAFSIS